MEGKLIVQALYEEEQRVLKAVEAAESRRAELTLRIQAHQMVAALYRAMAVYRIDWFGKPITDEELPAVIGTAEQADRSAIRAQRYFNTVFRCCPVAAPPGLAEKVCDALGVDWNTVEADRTLEEVEFWLFDRFSGGGQTPEEFASEWRHMHGDFSDLPVL